MKRSIPLLREEVLFVGCFAYNSAIDFHESVDHDIIVKVTKKMQLYRLIYYSLSALHVSGDVFARNM